MAKSVVSAMSGDADFAIEFRPSMVAFLLKSFTGWITLIATLVLSIPLLGLPLIVLGIMALGYRMTHFELSGERLFMRRGILSRSEEEIELYRIKDVRVDFSVIQQIFDVGNIKIISSDATGMGGGHRTTFLAPNIQGARRIREELRQRVERARKLKGVREFDA
ncbi:MAG: PH domain-containing protein [Sphingomonadaceae bacterium]